MGRKVLLGIFIVLIGAHAGAQQRSDSVELRKIKPLAISVGGSYSHLFTPDIVSNKGVLLNPTSSIFASIYFKFDKPNIVDSLFGSPRFGIGFQKPFYSERQMLGNPYTFYLLYSNTLAHLGFRLSLELEARLGASFGWHPYDKENNPVNRILGSSCNYHVGGSLYFKYDITRRFAAKGGVIFTHNSDGAYRLPNAGLNALGGFVEAMYSFEADSKLQRSSALVKSLSHPRYQLDVDFNYSSRQVRGTTENTNVRGIVPYRFKMMSVDGFLMFTNNPYIRAGIGLELIYDESMGITIIQEVNKDSGTSFFSYLPSSMSERFSPGFFGRIECAMGYINGYVDLGYIYSSNSRYYNAMCLNLGFKSYLYKGFNMKLGVQVVPYRKTNCATFGVGYTFNR